MGGKQSDGETGKGGADESFSRERGQGFIPT